VKTTATTAFSHRRFAGQGCSPNGRINGAAWVRFLHHIKWVSLETMAVEVVTGENALVTAILST
jgi:hypothetical protein